MCAGGIFLAGQSDEVGVVLVDPQIVAAERNDLREEDLVRGILRLDRVDDASHVSERRLLGNPLAGVVRADVQEHLVGIRVQPAAGRDASQNLIGAPTWIPFMPLLIGRQRAGIARLTADELKAIGGVGQIVIQRPTVTARATRAAVGDRVAQGHDVIRRVPRSRREADGQAGQRCGGEHAHAKPARAVMPCATPNRNATYHQRNSCGRESRQTGGLGIECGECGRGRRTRRSTMKATTHCNQRLSQIAKRKCHRRDGFWNALDVTVSRVIASRQG